MESYTAPKAWPTHLSIEVIFVFPIIECVDRSREGTATRVRGGRGNDRDILNTEPREIVSEATWAKYIILRVLGHG